MKKELGDQDLKDVNGGYNPLDILAPKPKDNVEITEVVIEGELRNREDPYTDQGKTVYNKD